MTGRRTDSPNMLTVTSGRITLGFLLRRGHDAVEAFDAREKSLGIYSNEREAADAIADAVQGD
jgi:hypothetical protein